jgi:KaiC/GvpD/RAD55 family RecA-like ATPase
MTAVVVPLPNIWGASAEDWTHFDMILGLLDDLLPVVSNPHAEIAEGSTLKALGKVPSVYDRAGKVVGLRNWTSRCTTANEMTGWAAQRDYGICVQTRRCRAIDIDIDDPVKAARIAAYVDKALGVALPRRVRDGTAKLLMPVLVAGEMGKTVIHTDGGAVEVLGNGQQFIAVGTHPKGAKYRWEGGLPGSIPEVSPDAFRELLAGLAEAYAIAPVVEGKAPGEREADIAGVDDPVADWLESQGLVEGSTPRGLKVRCPWADEHSDGNEEAMWLPAGGRGKAEGHFKCLHSHCEGRTRSDYLAAVGYVEDIASQFDDLSSEADAPIEELVRQQAAGRFPVVSAADFAARPQRGWIVKTLIPKGEVGMIFGDSTAGKTFVALDIMLSIARGVDWRGLKVKQLDVVYVVAEGSGGFSLRLQAYAAHHGVRLTDIPFGVIDNAPNLLQAEDVNALIAAIKAWGKPGVIVIDTLAQVTPNGDENSSKDMGNALHHAKEIARRCGAMTFLVHHSGKDATKGARGWSGGRNAMDCQIEIVRGDDGNRLIHNGKQKDGRDGQKWGFRLHDVWLGDDEDGDPVTSCVCVPVEDGAELPLPGVESGQKKPRKPRKPGAVECAIMGVMSELALGGIVKVPKADLIDAATRVVCEADGSKDFQGRYKVNRAIGSLITRKMLGHEGTFFFTIEGEL